MESPTDFGKFRAEATENWGKVIRAANIKPEWPCTPAHFHKFRSAAYARVMTRKAQVEHFSSAFSQESGRSHPPGTSPGPRRGYWPPRRSSHS
jgi:hypothetical protein